MKRPSLSWFSKTRCHEPEGFLSRLRYNKKVMVFRLDEYREAWFVSLLPLLPSVRLLGNQESVGSASVGILGGDVANHVQPRVSSET